MRQHNCHSQATCSNTVGSFNCACRTGYAGSGTSCADVNECTSNTHNCHSLATCSNTAGSFSCTCQTGYTGAGTSCADANECTSGAHNCHSLATCSNTVGSFTCACNSGYAGSGTVCATVGSGTYLWTVQFGSYSFDYGEFVAVDGSGNLLAAGFTGSSMTGSYIGGFSDCFVAKYSSNGQQLWLRQFGTTDEDSAYAVAADSAGSAYITGRTAASMHSQIFAGGSYDAFLTKYDTNGNWQWTRLFGSSGLDTGDGVAVDSSGYVYVCGYTAGAFHSQTYKGGNYDVFLTKYSSTGSRSWTVIYGSSAEDIGHAVAGGCIQIERRRRRRRRTRTRRKEISRCF